MTKEQHAEIKITIGNIEEFNAKLEEESERLNVEVEKMTDEQIEDNPDLSNLLGEMQQLVYDISKGIDNVVSRLEDVSGGLT